MFIQIIQGKCTRQDECREHGRALAARARTGGGRLARRHLRVHRRRPVHGDRAVRVARRPRTRTRARPEQGAWWAGDGGALRRPGRVPRLRRRHPDDGRRLRRRRLRPGDPRQGRRRRHAQGDDDRHRAAARDAPGDPRRHAGDRGRRHLHRDGRLLRRGVGPPGRAGRRCPSDVRRAMESAMHDVSYVDLHHPWFTSAGSGPADRPARQARPATTLGRLAPCRARGRPDQALRPAEHQHRQQGAEDRGRRRRRSASSGPRRSRRPSRRSATRSACRP